MASPWVDQVKAKSRLIAGRRDDQLVAFLQIEMPAGWKTYWRNPGDAGGLPPSFDFKHSENVAGTRVLYPAPKRLVDAGGATIGYKEHAVFPVEVDAADKAKPVQLRLTANFGVCRDICVPLQGDYALDVPPGAAGAVDGDLLEVLAQVPRAADRAKPGDPKLVSCKADASGAAPTIRFEAAVTGDAETADIFVEAPEGYYVPMPKRLDGAGEGGSVRFAATFSSASEFKVLLGQPLKVTLTSAAGQSETTVILGP